mgnify:CR=1 FL=1
MNFCFLTFTKLLFQLLRFLTSFRNPDLLTFGSNRVNFLSDPRHNSEILGKIGSQNPCNPVGSQIHKLTKFGKERKKLFCKKSSIFFFAKTARLNYLLDQNFLAKLLAQHLLSLPMYVPSKFHRCQIVK